MMVVCGEKDGAFFAMKNTPTSGDLFLGFPEMEPCREPIFQAE
jgi:hypothetical protein